MLAILSFALLSLGAVSQNDYRYIEYYHLINEGKNFYDKKQYDSSFYAYEKAFGLVEYVHNNHLISASSVCKKLGKRELANKYLALAESQEASINKAYKKYLDSICERDQKIRDGKHMKARDYYYKKYFDTTFVPDPKKYVESERLMKEWWQVDSSNIELIKRFIAEHGFPGEAMVGSETNDRVCIVILHYDRDTSNYIMKPTLDKALYEGLITPGRYAWIIDRHLHNVGKKQLYYSIPLGIEHLTPEERAIINNNRASIGLEKLEELIIIYRKNSTTVKFK